MAEETKKYYDKITSTIDATDVEEWILAIEAAEEARLDRPAVMDLLGARQSTTSEQETIEVDHIATVGEDWCRLALSVEERQIDVQDRVRRLSKEPREDDRQEVERLRGLLVAELSQLISLENQALVAIPRTVISPNDNEDVGLFDNIDDETARVVSATVQAPILSSTEAIPSNPPISPGVVSGLPTYTMMPATAMDDCPPVILSPEKQPISMPSNSLQDHPLRTTELLLRKQQAERYLNALRETIAEKSFHFSHVMRIAPKKSVRTRARANIVKLNERISLYSRVYTRCRNALVQLHADVTVLDQFQILRREDVNASTAILDPNLPGSTSLRLSWIWQTSGSGTNQSPEQVRECK